MFIANLHYLHHFLLLCRIISQYEIKYHYLKKFKTTVRIIVPYGESP
jgi:hypothetical protein